MADSSSLPYRERPEWKDVVPLQQEDGPTPLACIRYPKGFEEVHDYFRAIVQLDEYSERALQLTADVIEYNSANYTAWYYRRKCLREIKGNLEEELLFTDKWASDCPKNYQVWYHRRWLITEMADRLQKQDNDRATDAIRNLGLRELQYHKRVQQVNDDYKNYNGWSHRLFIVQKFNLWDKEMAFVEELLEEDIRNNSAWNHRFTVVRKTSWPLTDEVRNREIDFALNSIRQCANNESAWNYLAAFIGTGEGKVPWNSVPEVEALCMQVLDLTPDPQQVCRFALEASAKISEAKGDTAAALETYRVLAEVDKIRAKYWEWRIVALTGNADASTETDAAQ